MLPILLAGVFLSSLEMAIVSPVLPQVVEELRAVGLYPWVITSHVIAATLATPIAGYLADRLGRRSIWMAGVGCISWGSILCAISQNMPVLLVGRIFQGFGAGSLMPVTLIIMGDQLSTTERARAFGWISLVWGLSTLISPFLGGQLAEYLSWRGIFWAHLIIAIPLLLAFSIVLLEPPRTTPTAQPSHPLLTLWANPTHRSIVLMGIPLGAAILGPLSYIPIQVRGIQHGTPLDAGIALLPMSLAWTLGSNLIGRLLPHSNLQTLLRIGTLLVTLGAFLQLLHPMTGLFIGGLGLGMTISSANIASHEAAPPQLKGSATSLAITARNTGAALTVPMLGAISGFSADISDFSAIPDLAGGLQRVFTVVAFCALSSFLAIFFWFPTTITQEP